MKKPYAIIDTDQGIFFTERRGNHYLFGPLRAARRFATSALAAAILRDLPHLTGRNLAIHKSESMADKLTRKYKNKNGRR